MASGRGRGWCFTLNNYTESEVLALVAAPFKYLIYGKEVGDSGTPHLQGYVHFVDTKTRGQAKRILGPRFHLESRKGSLDQAIEYCKKDGDFHEFGTKPFTAKEKGQSEKDRWTAILGLAKAGNLEGLKTEYPREWLQFGPRLVAQYEPSTKPLDGELCHEWWVGSTGTGKSRLAWELYPHHFAKGLNKWWDGYAFQDVVIIEEWAPRNECTASFLKKWADRYAFPVEVKGAILPNIRPKKIIVLSNYTIEQCFPQKEDCDPLLRRFKVIQFPSGKFHATARKDNYKQHDAHQGTPDVQPPVQDPTITSDDAEDSGGYTSDLENYCEFFSADPTSWGLDSVPESTWLT